jgi:transglutaminase-like putative cysteine protease
MAVNDAAGASDRSAGETSARWRRLLVRHETRYRHHRPVTLAHHVAHLRPRDTARQTITDWRLQVEPDPDGGIVDAQRDVFGNWRLAFSHARRHDHLTVVSTFVAQVAPASTGAGSVAWDEAAQALRYRAGAVLPEACEFALDSPFAARDAALARWTADAFAPGRPLVEAARELMHRIHAAFEYRGASTDVATDARRAFAQGRGVCQDFAHVMIAALRSFGLAARYVSGYLLTEPAPGQPRLIGADASHAWVGVWCPRLGWVDLDPTNDLVVGGDHVTLAWGRDYGDVAPLRGVVSGGSQAPPQVSVSVTPIAP